MGYQDLQGLLVHCSLDEELPYVVETIETQMHFNDLIIRFRSIVLTAIVTLSGASIAFVETANLKNSDALFRMLIAALLIVWITAFILDLGYYHRLLIGSVNQALKFDNSDLGKKYGLFGLTTCIKNSVHPPASKKMIIIFYSIPAFGMIFLIVGNIFGLL